MPRMQTAPVILAILVVAAGTADRAARGEECLAGPNAPAPPGSHWYYRVDRAAHRKCWYLGAQRAKRHRAASARPSAAAAEAAPSAGASPPVESPAPVQAGALTPDAAFGSRWPEAPSLAADAAPRADADRAAATAAPVPERITARPVLTTAEPARPAPVPPKPQEAAPPRPAAPPPPAAAAAGGRSGLPAALLGIAFLLAVVGTMLVRARRRLVVRSWSEMRGPDERAAPDSVRVRRGLREILAKAEAYEARRPDERAARYPGDSMRIRRGLREVPAKAGTDAVRTDIAAATLQPAIDPLPPEPIDAAPDVEQSLRQLLQAWQRLAA
jgi:hypothetical protein